VDMNRGGLYFASTENAMGKCMREMRLTNH